ncbi:MAG: C-terminal helicase domain-containing protein [Halioglobus sp.]|nr:C-terminal helicase domain-containing protein [Halioglobus sp.]
MGRERQAHKNIRHQLVLADNQNHKDKLLCALLPKEAGRRTLVFCNRRRTADRLTKLLGQHGLHCASLHGGLSTEVRKQVVRQFHENKVHVVCATDLAARGLDVEAIAAVINYDIPESVDDYVHRSGRCGRAGTAGLAISLADAREWRYVSNIERLMGLTLERRSLAGLKARYNGPPATNNRMRPSTKRTHTGNHTARQPTEDERRHEDKESNDGFGPLTKKLSD